MMGLPSAVFGAGATLIVGTQVGGQGYQVWGAVAMDAVRGECEWFGRSEGFDDFYTSAARAPFELGKQRN